MGKDQEVGENDESSPLQGTSSKRKNSQRGNILLRPSSRTVAENEATFGHVGQLCCSLIVSLMVLAFFNIISLGAIIIGSLYLDPKYCPIQPHLAPLLIASGTLGMLLVVIEGKSRIDVARNDDGGPTDALYVFILFLRVTKFMVLICLLVFVLSAYPHIRFHGSHDPTPVSQHAIKLSDNGTSPAKVAITVSNSKDFNYCHPHLYFYAFWAVLVTITAIGFIVFLLCCVCCFAALLATVSDDE